MHTVFLHFKGGAQKQVQVGGLGSCQWWFACGSGLHGVVVCILGDGDDP